jgi:adenosylhomocysteinase
MSKHKNNPSKQNGNNLLGWAEERMPILKEISRRFIDEKPLKGMKIGVALHLEKKTGVLLQTLQKGGAEVSASSCNPLTTDDDVAIALSDEMSVHAWSNQTDDEYYECLKNVLDSNPRIIIDDGCDLIFLAHKQYPEIVDSMYGACEETTTGIVRLRAMHKDNALKFPVMAVNNAYSKYLFDNRYGTGQSVIEGILSATNTLIAGKNVVVIGYGWCGRGIAQRLKGLGAKVHVVETSNFTSDGPSGYHRALEALYDGCWVGTLDEIAGAGDIFISATGNKDVINKEHMKKMKDGAILANAGHFNNEIDLKGLESISSSSNEILTNVDRYDLNNGKHIILLSKGRLVNLSQPTGQGHPIEIMDASFATQALCVEHLVKNYKNLDHSIHDVPEQIDNEVARIALSSHDIFLDDLTEDQKKYLQTWQEGT